MNCSVHTDREATGTCVDCGRSLCPECCDKYKPVLCPSCAEARNKQELKKAVTTLVISAVLFIAALIFNQNPDSPWYSMNRSVGSSIFTALVLAGVPWGWITLNKITSNFFMFLPIIGWFFYVVVKLMLSMVIGIFAMIYKIAYYIYKLVKYNKMEKYIKNNE